MSNESQLNLNDEQELVSLVSKHRHKKIGLDGLPGVGKTTLAEHLATALGLDLVKLDDYFSTNPCPTDEEILRLRQEGFVNSLDYERLQADLRGMKSFVIEGICLLEVLNRLDTHLDLIIYVKKQHLGQWVDDPARVSGRSHGGNDREIDLITQETLRYHSSHNPQDSAEVIFWRNSDDTTT